MFIFKKRLQIIQNIRRKNGNLEVKCKNDLTKMTLTKEIRNETKKTLTKKFHKRDSKNVPQKWFAEIIARNDSQKRLK